MIAEKTGTAERPTAPRRAYEKPSLTEHGSLAVRTAGQPGLLLDAIISIGTIS
ncbi:lasso RiPP family leader peptide-containing protein [Frankia sp. AgB1.9]|uniref:lasso RiPP family leader peptide-containing protein n=1 Tax=unclassified Frankia TaxID=2632575 RepID=UPI0019315FB7|nr:MULTISPECIES: lasso RiPP family leader peptide-containing protein [unclassified Frankia]MBL7488121.1 lasso RiPP family leader peptide-containing protein [Frankia sp. AgW1.1]MBL7553858.1 lasso RiPP family leader peptide-containing protein [Frankia sp. AgB1.9]MBL7624257.1 lasso RiPP family leader peptide-containing protein [Frankia sp. AgB1.8]